MKIEVQSSLWVVYIFVFVINQALFPKIQIEQQLIGSDECGDH